MSLQVILKNSSVFGKEPLASQLANGELALNYHADGPFLTCKDSAGTIRRIAGVWISATAPASPTPGETWLDISLTPAQLKIYQDVVNGWIFAVAVNVASTSTAGVVQLATSVETQTGTNSTKAVTPLGLQSKISDSTSTSSNTTIASSAAVKTAYDLANTALPKAGGTMTGQILADDSTSPSTPGYAFDGDTSTGLLRTGSNALALSTGGSSRLTISATGVVTIPGDLVINGTTTTVNTDNLTVKDKNIELGKVTTPTDITADGGGITLKGTTDKTLNWVDATDSWSSSENINLASGKTYKINNVDVLSATALGSTVQISSANIPSGVIVNDDVSATAEIAVSKLADGAARQLLQTDAAGTGVEWASNIDIPGTLDVTGATTLDSTLTIPLGSAAAPSIYPSGDTNTGLYSPGADQLAITTSGTARLTIDSSGRVGIGTTSPGENLAVWGAASNPGVIGINGESGQVSRLQFKRANTNRFKIECDISDNLLFYSDASTAERARFDSSGRLLVGTSDARSVFRNSTNTALLQVEGANDETRRYTSTTYGLVGASGPIHIFAKHRSDTLGGQTIVASGDEIGGVLFSGSDGTNFVDGASIYGYVDGTPGANDMPGRLVFSTTADGAAFPTERMRIDSAGRLLVGTGSNNSRSDFFSTNLYEPLLQVEGASSSGQDSSRFVSLVFGNASANGPIFVLGKHRSNTKGGVTLVVSGDECGRVSFQAADGAKLNEIATVVANIDGTPGLNDTPGKLSFSTTPDGSTLPVVRLSIDSAGDINISTGGNIKADFSNATLTSRTYFQTSTANNATTVGVIPNGTSTGSALYAFNNSTPTNASYVGAVVTNTVGTIRSAITGTGTYLPLTFETNNQEQARFTTTDRYFRMAASTGGIQFNGDTAATNALDDYEEGTITTPAIAGTTTAGTGTYSVQAGRYTKIGRLVQVQIRLIWSAHTGTGNMKITGLPFTVLSTGGSSEVAAALRINNLTSPASTTVQAVCVSNTTEINFESVAIAGGLATLLALDTAADVLVTAVYTT